MAPVIGVDGDVIINDNAFRVVPDTYQVVDVSDWSPKGSTPGSSQGFADLTSYQPDTQESWTHGMGFVWAEDVLGYLRTEGNIDTRQAGMLMLYNERVTSDSENSVKRGGFTFGGKTYTYGAAGLRRLDTPGSETWSTVFAGDVTFAFQNGTYIFVFPALTVRNGRAFKSLNGNLDTSFASLTTSLAGNNNDITLTSLEAGANAASGNDISFEYVTGGQPGSEIVTVTGGVKAHVDIEPSGSNNDLRFTAFNGGTDGNSITIAYTLGGVAGEEIVSVTGSAISIQVSAGNTTANQVKAAFAASDAASALVTVADEGGDNGTGTIPSAVGATALSGGTRTNIKVKIAAGTSTANQVITKLQASIAAMNFVTVALAGGNDGTGTIPGAMASTALAGATGSANWTKTGINANAKGFGQALLHNGFCYVIEAGTKYVHRASATSLSDLEGNGLGDSDAIPVGPGDIPVTHLITYGDQLYATRYDGLYAIGQDNIARKTLDFTPEYSTSNFRSIAVYNSLLIFTIRDKVIAWSGSKSENITPGANADVVYFGITDVYPYVSLGRFDNLLTRGEYLYMTARTSDATYNEVLLCWNGVGWNVLAYPVTNGADTITTLFADMTNLRMWYHVQKAGSNETAYFSFNELSELPAQHFPTSGTHRITFSRKRMGYPYVKKSAASIKLNCENLAAGRSVQVEYCLDGGSWTALGSPIVANGLTELRFATATTTVEFNWIGIRLTLATSGATQTPIVTDVTLRYLMRPKLVLGWSMQIVAATNAKYGDRIIARTAAETEALLVAARASPAPVSYVAENGGSHYISLTALRGKVIERHATGGVQSTGLELVYQVSLIQVGASI